MLEIRLRRTHVLAVLALAAASTVLPASDHGDGPHDLAGSRPDANITDLHAFVVGPNLVVAVSTNPAIPRDATTYRFPTDVTFDVNIDSHCPVDPADPQGDGGTILDPDGIREDVTFTIRFRDDGSARVHRIDRRDGRAERPSAQRGSRTTRGVTAGPAPGGTVGIAAREGVGKGGGNDPGLVAFFAGLRDDPFIRGPRQGRNVGAILFEVPLSSIVRDQPTLVIWATSQIDGMEGSFQELTGRSLKSMFAENGPLNEMHPRDHLELMGIMPDVVILDTTRPVAFPNGRALTDDVVDLVGDPRVLGNDAPYPTANDVPFLSTFPYLAPPHPPVP